MHGYITSSTGHEHAAVLYHDQRTHLQLQPQAPQAPVRAHVAVLLLRCARCLAVAMALLALPSLHGATAPGARPPTCL